MKSIIIGILIIVAVALSGYTFFDQQLFGNIENPKNNNGGVAAERKLDLSNQSLDKIPGYVFGMQELEELDISNNKIGGAIQAEIRNLKNLKVLNASNNLMTGAPAEIGQLINLEVLDLSDNQLTGLPYELGNLKNLKTFDISGNNYSELDLNIISQKLPAGIKIIR